MIRLFDTQFSEIREIEPKEAGKFSIYVCGPTVYDRPHLGHGRFVLVYDILRRFLAYQGFDVRFISNITDIDDKILDRASKEGISPKEVADTYEQVWWETLDRLGVMRPDEAPHATDWLAEMVELIELLIESGAAYSTPEGVYFEVEKAPGYGLLARQDLSELRAGARVEVVQTKRSPFDFALWKLVESDEWGWQSPFGYGRPGWHTECVVMALGLLGEGFDLHGGGLDLCFPHHENERIQAVASGREFARHWMHNGFVMVGDEKMSKSLGNFETLENLLERFDSRSYRLLVLRSHYRSPMDVTPENSEDAERALERIDAFARRFTDLCERNHTVGADEGAMSRFVAAMSEDLNTPVALSYAFEAITGANGSMDRGQRDKAVAYAKAALAQLEILGLVVESKVDVPAEVVALAELRVAARRAKDYALADNYRQEILDLGYVVEDAGSGFGFRRA